MNAMIDNPKPTKARSKRQRIARKRERRAVDPMGLAATPRREKDGRTHRTTAERDAATEALQARCRQAGKAPTPDAMRDARLPWWGCQAGVVIGNADITHDQRLTLWDAAQHMRRVWASYYRAIGIADRYPKCMGIIVPPDRTETDAASPPLDTRTDEERERAAVSAMMRVEGFLGRISAIASSECKRVVLDDQPCHDAPGLLAGLRVVSEGISGKF
jgi:hypothetical protein